MKKEMKLDFALNLLYQEATSEETKYTPKQKEKAYHSIKDSILINELIKPIINYNEIIKCLIYRNATDVGKELIQEWLNK